MKSFEQIRNKNKILQIPIDDDINRHNAFDQDYKRLSYKFEENSDLIYMEYI